MSLTSINLITYILLNLSLSGFYFFFQKSAITKIIPILVAAIFVFSFNSKSNVNRYIAIGLIFSSFGDIFLEIENSEIDLFIPGLLSFLCAHILYICSFRIIPFNYKSYIPIVLIVAVYFIVLMYILLPHIEPALKVPVIIYGLVISCMVYSAITRSISDTQGRYLKSKTLVILGSISFAISDSILAIDKFRSPISNAKILVMITYYIGQVFIAGSALLPYSHNLEKQKL